MVLNVANLWGKRQQTPKATPVSPVTVPQLPSRSNSGDSLDGWERGWPFTWSWLEWEMLNIVLLGVQGRDGTPYFTAERDGTSNITPDRDETPNFTQREMGPQISQQREMGPQILQQKEMRPQISEQGEMSIL